MSKLTATILVAALWLVTLVAVVVYIGARPAESMTVAPPVLRPVCSNATPAVTAVNAAGDLTSHAQTLLYIERPCDDAGWVQA